MTLPTTLVDYRARWLEHPDQFVDYIRRRCEEPGVRAALRRGVGHRPDTAHRSHAYVAGWVTPRDDVSRAVDEAREWAYYAVAAMMAAQLGRARRSDDADRDSAESSSEPTNADDPPAHDGTTAGRFRANLGASMAKAVTRGGTGQRAIAQDSAEKRLHLLTRQGLAGLHRHLPATVRHLRVANIPIDWAVLIRDLSRWSTGRDAVAKDWLQAFYRTINVPASNSSTSGSAQS